MEKVDGVKEGEILSFDDFGDLRRFWHLSHFQILALAARITYEKEHNLPLSISRAPFNPIPMNNNPKRKMSDLGDDDHQNMIMMMKKKMKMKTARVMPFSSIDLNSNPGKVKKIMKKPRTTVGVPRKHPIKFSADQKVEVQVQKLSEKQQQFSDSTSSELPAEFRRKMLELGGSHSDPKMVFQKVLTATDVNPTQARLTISANSSTLQLTDAEKTDADRKDEGNRVPGFKVLVIDPGRKIWSMDFKKWGGINAYALNGSWNKLVRENGLKKGHTLQVWSFRCSSGDNQNQLCFALVKTKTEVKTEV